MKENQEKSLEDKAKEIEFYGNFEKDLDKSLDRYLLGEIDTEELIKRIHSFTRKQMSLTRKQALKDMMERAEELQLPHIRMYKIIAEELSK